MDTPPFVGYNRIITFFAHFPQSANLKKDVNDLTQDGQVALC